MNLTLYVIYLLDIEDSSDMNLRTEIGSTTDKEKIPGILKAFAEDVGLEPITESEYMVDEHELPILELKEFFNQK